MLGPFPLGSLILQPVCHLSSTEYNPCCPVLASQVTGLAAVASLGARQVHTCTPRRRQASAHPSAHTRAQPLTKHAACSCAVCRAHRPLTLAMTWPPQVLQKPLRPLWVSQASRIWVDMVSGHGGHGGIGEWAWSTWWVDMVGGHGGHGGCGEWAWWTWWNW